MIDRIKFKSRLALLLLHSSQLNNNFFPFQKKSRMNTLRVSMTLPDGQKAFYKLDPQTTVTKLKELLVMDGFINSDGNEQIINQGSRHIVPRSQEAHTTMDDLKYKDEVDLEVTLVKESVMSKRQEDRTMIDFKNKDQANHPEDKTVKQNATGENLQDVITSQDLKKQIQILKYNNGSVYEGDMMNGQRHGKGLKKHPDGTSYEGDWINDVRQGKGVYKWADGAFYQGDFYSNLRTGRGTMIYTDGSVYDGDWINDQKQGWGVLTLEDGSVYKGNWVSNNRHGKGIKKYPDGTTYDGEWKFNKFNGRGIIIYYNGVIYEGEWVDGLKHGKGVQKFPSGTVYEGYWRNDKAHGRGKMRYSEGIIYDGDWDNNKADGGATITYSDGAVYEGECKDGKRHGHGTMRDSVGFVSIGDWANDERIPTQILEKNLEEERENVEHDKRFIPPTEERIIGHSDERVFSLEWANDERVEKLKRHRMPDDFMVNWGREQERTKACRAPSFNY